MAVLFYILTRNVFVTRFLLILAAFSVIAIFHFTHSDRYMWQYLPVILIHITLLANGVEPIFMCLFAISISSEICLCFFTHSLIRLFYCLVLKRFFLYILDISPFSDMWLANIYFQSIAYLSFS